MDHAEVGPDCLVGPYARLRPGAVMERGAHMGNFVEMKKARLCEGAQGQPPYLFGGCGGRRAGEHRSGYDHLQL